MLVVYNECWHWILLETVNVSLARGWIGNSKFGRFENFENSLAMNF